MIQTCFIRGSFPLLEAITSLYGRCLVFNDLIQDIVTFIFQIFLFRNLLQERDGCCYVTSDTQLLSENPRKPLLISSVQQVVFNLRNRNCHSEKT